MQSLKSMMRPKTQDATSLEFAALLDSSASETSEDADDTDGEAEGDEKRRRVAWIGLLPQVLSILEGSLA